MTKSPFQKFRFAAIERRNALTRGMSDNADVTAKLTRTLQRKISPVATERRPEALDKTHIGGGVSVYYDGYFLHIQNQCGQWTRVDPETLTKLEQYIDCIHQENAR